MRWRAAIDQRLSNLVETIRAHQRTLNDHHRRIDTQRAQIEELDNVVTVLIDRLDAYAGVVNVAAAERSETSSRLTDLDRAISALTHRVAAAAPSLTSRSTGLRNEPVDL